MAKPKTVDELIKLAAANLSESLARWEHIRLMGSRDPFWPDGCNMNLVRNHIIYYKRELLELCEGRELPSEYYLPTPEEVDKDYMAPNGEFYKDRVRKMAKLHRPINTKMPSEIGGQQELF